MSDPIDKPSKKATRRTLNIPVLRGVHWAAKQILKGTGYQFEARRSGDLQLGLWRRALNPPRQRGRTDGATSRRLVIVPGFGDTPLSWMPLLALLEPLLKRRYDEIVYFDFPGYHGFLSAERSFHSMDLLLGEVADVLDTLRPQAIFGHSLGGWLASHYAGQCGAGNRPRLKTAGDAHGHYAGPETVILANPSGVFDDPELKRKWIDLFMRLRTEGFQLLRPHVFAREPFWFRFFGSEFGKLSDNQEILQFIESVRDDHSVQPMLPQMKCKVWLIWGEKDTLVPTAFSEGWMRHLPAETEPRLLLLKNIGHTPQLENPAVTAAALAQILLGVPADKIARRGRGRWWTMQSKPTEPATGKKTETPA